MSYRLPVLRTLIVFFALSGIARGQNVVEAGFGIRGGLLANESFQGSQFCGILHCNISTPDRLNGTVGPAVNVLLYDRVEVRFEGVHQRFESQVQTTNIVLPTNTQNGGETRTVETTQGKLWEYPLLATYHFRSGRIRPYAGGGLSLGITGTRSTETVITTTVTSLNPPQSVTTSGVSRSSASLSSWAPYYLVAGIDGRISHVSIKPEFRYSHSFADQAVSEQINLKPNQFEFLLGVSVQFGVKKLGTHR
jgi:outer membrane protein W